MSSMLKSLILGTLLAFTATGEAQEIANSRRNQDRGAERRSEARRNGRFEDRRGQGPSNRRIVKGDKVMTTAHEILIVGDVFPDGFVKLYTVAGSFWKNGNTSQLTHYSECAGEICKGDKVMTTAHEILVVSEVYPDGFVKLNTVSGSFWKNGNTSQLAHYSECAGEICKGDKVMTTAHEILIVGEVYPDGFVKLNTVSGSFWKNGDTSQLAPYSDCASGFCKGDKVMTASHDILVVGEVFPDGFVKLYTVAGSFWKNGNTSELSAYGESSRGGGRGRRN